MWELPGYQLERKLGEGGMGEVFLATQRRTGRRVAIKRLLPSLSVHPDFRALFARECETASRLSHPAIVALLETISTGQELCLIMEYMGGGDLRARLAHGMHMSTLLSTLRELALGLDYAHRQGVTHGDIKPEHILFREDDSVALADFGLARLLHTEHTERTEHTEQRLHQNGFAAGSLPYMSPEQLGQQTVDDRADFYSLGVVLYQVLTGDVPYRADNAATLLQRQLQEPVPRLPSHVAAFQPIVERLLARRSEQRYANGAELVTALDRVRADGLLPNTTIRTEVVNSAEIRAVSASLLIATKDALRRPQAEARRDRSSLMTLSLIAILGILAVSMAGYWIATNPVRVQTLLADLGITEQPGLNEAWNEARSLRQDPNQGLRTLVAAYERVLAIDPQHPGARQDMASLAGEWKDSIREALAGGNFGSAQTRLAEARQAFPDDAEFPALAAELEDRRTAEALLTSTQALLRSHGVDDVPSVSAAIQSYYEILRLSPGHPVARSELDAIADHYARKAADEVAAGNMDLAISALDRASTANPSLPEIATIRQAIQRTTSTLATIEQFLEEARGFRESGQLVSPAGDNAAAIYHKILSIDPDNAIATQGLNEVVARLRAMVAQRLAIGDFPAVADIVSQASAVNLDPVAVESFRQQLVAEQERVKAVNRLLEEARQYIRDGFLTAPERGNAALALREVQRLDPGNSEARALLRTVAERLAEVAREARGAGLNAEALQYLDLALAVVPGVEEWQTLRENWGKGSANGR
ncbi:MAG: serine/threonine-protein kinase [Pseudomonadales bacterium]